MLTFTNVAFHKLKDLVLEKNELPRIDAEIKGGCSLNLNFKLKFDEIRRNDTVIKYKDLYIRIDPFTKRYIDDVNAIDYTDAHGFCIETIYKSSTCKN